MLIFGKIKHLHSLSTVKKPLINPGWMRSLLFFATFLLMYLLLNAVYMQTILATTLPFLYSGALVFAVAAVLIVPVFVVHVDAQSLQSLGFSLKGRLKDAATGAMLAVALLVVTSLILIGTSNLTLRPGIPSVGNLFSGFAIMCIVAFAEETVFRGYILGNLLLSFNRWIALFLSAFLFSFVHTSNPGISLAATGNVFLAGLLLGVNYVFTRNLWFGICFHLAWNFVQGPVLGFNVSGLQHEGIFNASVSGNRFITGDPFGPEGSVIVTILLVTSVVLLKRYYETHRYVSK
ncbi:MAG: CPBP family intramembrane metalloprotease [Chitinophagaceae bacterium]|nr:MAG: CPBP family intramembrane metalloprotease [Chitinophagaceae bacterium]